MRSTTPESEPENSLQSLCGKTYLGRWKQTTTLSDACSLASSESKSRLSLQGASGRTLVMLLGQGDPSPGASSTLNTSVSPNRASDSSLSRVLDVTFAPQRLFLSERAIEGILRRFKEKKLLAKYEKLVKALNATSMLRRGGTDDT